VQSCKIPCSRPLLGVWYVNRPPKPHTDAIVQVIVQVWIGSSDSTKVVRRFVSPDIASSEVRSTTVWKERAVTTITPPISTSPFNSSATTTPSLFTTAQQRYKHFNRHWRDPWSTLCKPSNNALAKLVNLAGRPGLQGLQRTHPIECLEAKTLVALSAMLISDL
jgi:hypothetical protein